MRTIFKSRFIFSSFLGRFLLLLALGLSMILFLSFRAGGNNHFLEKIPENDRFYDHETPRWKWYHPNIDPEKAAENNPRVWTEWTTLNNKYSNWKRAAGLDRNFTNGNWLQLNPYAPGHWRNSIVWPKANVVVFGPNSEASDERFYRLKVIARARRDGTFNRYKGYFTIPVKDLFRSKEIWSEAFTDSEEAAKFYEKPELSFFKRGLGYLDRNLAATYDSDLWLNTSSGCKMCPIRVLNKAEKYYAKQLFNHKKIADQGYFGAADYPNGITGFQLDEQRGWRAIYQFNTGSMVVHYTFGIENRQDVLTKYYSEKLNRHRYEVAQLLKTQNAFSDSLQLMFDGLARMPLSRIRDLNILETKDYSALLGNVDGDYLTMPIYNLKERNGRKTTLKVMPRLLRFEGVSLDPDTIEKFEKGINTPEVEQLHQSLLKTILTLRKFFILRNRLYLSDWEMFSIFLNGMRFYPQLQVAQIQHSLSQLKNFDTAALAQIPLLQRQTNKWKLVNIQKLVNLLVTQGKIDSSFELFPNPKTWKQPVWKKQQNRKQWLWILQKIRLLGELYRHGQLHASIETNHQKLKDTWKWLHRFLNHVKDQTGWDYTLKINGKNYDLNFFKGLRISDYSPSILPGNEAARIFLGRLVYNQVSSQLFNDAYRYDVLTSKTNFYGRSFLDVVASTQATQIILNRKLFSLSELLKNRGKVLNEISELAKKELRSLPFTSVAVSSLLDSAKQLVVDTARWKNSQSDLLLFRRFVPNLENLETNSNELIMINLLLNAAASYRRFEELSLDTRLELRLLGETGIDVNKLRRAFIYHKHLVLSRFWTEIRSHLLVEYPDFLFERVVVNGQNYRTDAFFNDRLQSDLAKLDQETKAHLQKLLSDEVSFALLQTALKEERIKNTRAWEKIYSFFQNEHRSFVAKLRSVFKSSPSRTYDVRQLHAESKVKTYKQLSPVAKRQLELLVNNKIDFIQETVSLNNKMLGQMHQELQPLVSAVKKYHKTLLERPLLVNGQTLLLNQFSVGDSSKKLDSQLSAKVRLQLKQLFQVGVVTPERLSVLLGQTNKRFNNKIASSRSAALLLQRAQLDSLWNKLQPVIADSRFTWSEISINQRTYYLDSLLSNQNSQLFGSQLDQPAKAQLQKLVDDNIKPQDLSLFLETMEPSSRQKLQILTTDNTTSSTIRSKSTPNKKDRWESVWTGIASTTIIISVVSVSFALGARYRNSPVETLSF